MVQGLLYELFKNIVSEINEDTENLVQIKPFMKFPFFGPVLDFRLQYTREKKKVRGFPSFSRAGRYEHFWGVRKILKKFERVPNFGKI